MTAPLAEAPVLTVAYPPLPEPGGRAVIHVEDRVVGSPEADDYPRGRSWVSRQRTTQAVKADAHGRPVVVKADAELRHGRTRTGKTWSRWATVSVRMLSVTSTGEWLLRASFRARGQRGMGWTSQVVHDVDTDGHYGVDRDLVTLMTHYAGPAPSFVRFYPLAEHYLGRAVSGGVAALGRSDFRAAFRHTPDTMTLTRRLFGATRYRKDLAREVAQARLDHLYLAWQFRGLVPVDWIVDFLHRAREYLAQSRDRRGVPGRSYVGISNLPSVRPHLRALPETTLRRLLRDENAWTTAGDRYRIDLARFAPGPHAAARNWFDLHERAWRYGRPAKNSRAKKPRRARLPEQAKALTGTTPGGLRIEIARTEETLVAWGAAMEHCIGGYGADLASGARWLGAVWDDQTLLGNFSVQVTRADGEVTGARLEQLLGYKNRTLPAEVRADVTAHLRARDVTVGRYWGNGA